MTRKTADLVVKTGEYSDRDGNPKARWLNIGAEMENENGTFFILDRHINLAGLPGDPNKGVMVSRFTKKQQQGDHRPQSANSGQEDPFDTDSIPF